MVELQNTRNILQYGIYGIFWNTENKEYTRYSQMRDERKVFKKIYKWYIFLPWCSLSRAKLWMMMSHFLATKDITMCYREEIIQNDSPPGDMFSQLSGREFFEPLGLLKHSRHTWRWRKSAMVSLSIALTISCLTYYRFFCKLICYISKCLSNLCCKTYFIHSYVWHQYGWEGLPINDLFGWRGYWYLS